MKALSLFANVGLAETYLNELGIDVIIANELDNERARFYSHLYPNCNMISGDITDPNVLYKVLNESKNADIDIIIATPLSRYEHCRAQ